MHAVPCKSYGANLRQPRPSTHRPAHPPIPEHSLSAEKPAGRIGVCRLRQQYGRSGPQAKASHEARVSAHLIACSQSQPITWLWAKNAYPKWNPGKWNQRLKPAVLWWLCFDPYPLGRPRLRVASLLTPSNPTCPSHLPACQHAVSPHQVHCQAEIPGLRRQAQPANHQATS